MYGREGKMWIQEGGVWVKEKAEVKGCPESETEGKSMELGEWSKKRTLE